MDLSYTDEQLMLRDSVVSFLAEQYTFEKRQTALAADPLWRPDIWKAFAEELQILGISFPEEFGGFGGGAIDNLLLMEEFGRVVAVEPYLSTIVMAGGLLKRVPYDGAGDTIERIIAGQEILSFGFSERASRFNIAAVETRATADGSGWVVDGHKKLVLAAPYADRIIITARTAGGPREKDGISLFIIDANADGVSLNSYTTYDGFRAADITFDGVRIGTDALIGEKDNGFGYAERTVDDGIAAICGESVGVMQKMLDLTLEYAKERNQFGKPISSFQALQHRMSDMFIDVEQAKSMALLGAISAEDDDPIRRAKGISKTKAQIGGACKRVGQSAIQVHGGMGITDEMCISHYFKRSTTLEGLFGTVDYHLTRIEQLDDLAS